MPAARATITTIAVMTVDFAPLEPVVGAWVAVVLGRRRPAGAGAADLGAGAEPWAAIGRGAGAAACGAGAGAAGCGAGAVGGTWEATSAGALCGAG